MAPSVWYEKFNGKRRVLGLLVEQDIYLNICYFHILQDFKRKKYLLFSIFYFYLSKIFTLYSIGTKWACTMHKCLPLKFSSRKVSAA